MIRRVYLNRPLHLGLAMVGLAPAMLAAQPFDLSWHTIDGGGAMNSTDGTFSLSGTIGQPDAGVMAGGTFTLTGGFWAVGQTAIVPENPFPPGAPGVSVGLGLHDGYIDPRQESSNGVALDRGLDELVLRFVTALENENGSPLSADRFGITDTAGSPPAIVGITTADNVTVTVELDGIITVDAWTTVSVAGVRSIATQAPYAGSVDIGFLPGDVTQDRNVTPIDLLRFRQYLLNVIPPPLGVRGDYIDTNRDTAITPLDLLRFRQLITGVSPSTRNWAGETLPAQP